METLFSQWHLGTQNKERENITTIVVSRQSLKQTMVNVTLVNPMETRFYDNTLYVLHTIY